MGTPSLPTPAMKGSTDEAPDPLGEILRWSLFSLAVPVVGAGCLGNVLLLVVMWNRRKVRGFHNTFIANLAMADFMVLLSAGPVFLVTLAQVDGVAVSDLCKASGVLFSLGLLVALISLVLISFNRYVKVCHRPLFRKLFSARRNFCVCVVVWVVAAAFSCSSLLLETASHNITWYSEEFHVCQSGFEPLSGGHPAGTVAKVLLHALTPVLITFFNAAIFRRWQGSRTRLRHNRGLKHLRGGKCRKSKTGQVQGRLSRTSTLRTLLTLSVAHFHPPQSRTHGEPGPPPDPDPDPDYDLGLDPDDVTTITTATTAASEAGEEGAGWGTTPWGSQLEDAASDVPDDDDADVPKTAAGSSARPISPREGPGDQGKQGGEVGAVREGVGAGGEGVEEGGDPQARNQVEECRRHSSTVQVKRQPELDRAAIQTRRKSLQVPQTKQRASPGATASPTLSATTSSSTLSPPTAALTERALTASPHTHSALSLPASNKDGLGSRPESCLSIDSPRPSSAYVLARRPEVAEGSNSVLASKTRRQITGTMTLNRADSAALCARNRLFFFSKDRKSLGKGRKGSNKERQREREGVQIRTGRSNDAAERKVPSWSDFDTGTLPLQPKPAASKTASTGTRGSAKTEGRRLSVAADGTSATTTTPRASRNRKTAPGMRSGTGSESPATSLDVTIDSCSGLDSGCATPATSSRTDPNACSDKTGSQAAPDEDTSTEGAGPEQCICTASATREPTSGKEVQRSSTAKSNMTIVEVTSGGYNFTLLRSVLVITLTVSLLHAPFAVTLAIKSWDAGRTLQSCCGPLPAIATLLLLANSAVNWIVYGMLQTVFRAAFFHTLQDCCVACCCCCCCCQACFRCRRRQPLRTPSLREPATVQRDSTDPLGDV